MSSKATLEIRDGRRPGWHWAYHEVVDEYGAKLGPHGLAIYYALCRHANDNRECWPSYSTLAKETGMSRRQAIRAVKRLATEGLILKEPRKDDAGDPTSNRYILLDFDPENEGSAKETPPGEQELPQVVSGSDHGSARETPKGEPSKENKSKGEPNSNTNLELKKKTLRDLGVVGRIVPEIAEKHGLNWIEAAFERMGKPEGIVYLHREGWEPTAEKQSPEEVRYRYIEGEYAEYVQH